MLGGVLAAPVFASSVVAIPLLLDRKVGVLGAVLTSWRVVMEHPAAAGAVGGADHGPDAAGHGHRCCSAWWWSCPGSRTPAGTPTATWSTPPGWPTTLSPTMFGYTEEQIAQFGLTFGVSAFMLYMVFIIFQLARESKAGRFGTFVLFLALGFGLVGFAAKGLIKFFSPASE
jgi:hypothetical protein